MIHELRSVTNRWAGVSVLAHFARNLDNKLPRSDDMFVRDGQ
jgi:hypothetical protein